MVAVRILEVEGGLFISMFRLLANFCFWDNPLIVDLIVLLIFYNMMYSAQLFIFSWYKLD